MFKVLNAIIIIGTIVLIFAMFSKTFQYYLVSMLFSTIAPSSENISMKPFSDKLYHLKTSIEKDLQIALPTVIQQQVRTVQYHDIKDDLDDTLFYNITNGHTTPILIKNIYDPSILAPYTFTKLKEKHGDIMVEAIKYDRSNSGKIDSTKVTFGEYLDMIDAGMKYYMTVNNSIAIAIDKKNFMEFYRNILKGSNGCSNMFIGNTGSSTHLHSELVGSCATQISGIKKWYLIDPKYSEYLNPIPDKNNIFQFATRGFIKNRDEIIENIPRYEIIVEPGDFLFVPPWWWHETLNLSDENIMLSYRPSLFKAPFKTNPMYTMLGVKNSIGFNDLIYPLLVKGGVVDEAKDMVVQSITQIAYRMPDDIKQKIGITDEEKIIIVTPDV